MLAVDPVLAQVLAVSHFALPELAFRAGILLYLVAGSQSEPTSDDHIDHVANVWFSSRALGHYIESHRGDSDWLTLATKMNVSLATLSKWRKGESLPTSANLESIASVLLDKGSDANEDGFTQRYERELVTLRVLRAVSWGFVRAEEMLGVELSNQVARALRQLVWPFRWVVMKF